MNSETSFQEHLKFLDEKVKKQEQEIEELKKRLEQSSEISTSNSASSSQPIIYEDDQATINQLDNKLLASYPKLDIYVYHPPEGYKGLRVTGSGTRKYKEEFKKRFSAKWSRKDLSWCLSPKNQEQLLEFLSGLESS